MTVINLAAARDERQPHWEGEVRCIGCGHEWRGVAPMGTHSIECPGCRTMRGVPKYPFGAAQGDAFLQCNCGCEALTAYKRKGTFYVKCMACGDDLTTAFYEG